MTDTTPAIRLRAYLASVHKHGRAATGAPDEDDLRALLDEHEQARASAVLGGTDDGCLHIVCPSCDWDATYPSLDLLTATAIVREHVASHVPLCVCGCQPGQTCDCGPDDCECLGECSVCDVDEEASGQ